MTSELILFAFLAGLATVVSPCVLPVLPLVLSTTAVGSQQDPAASGLPTVDRRLPTAWRPVGVVLGLAVSFTFATLVAGAAVRALALPTAWLRVVAIAALGLFGLSMLVPAWGRARRFWILDFGFAILPKSQIQSPKSKIQNSFAGGLLVGAGLGLVWSPCVGPIMGTVIALAVSNGLSGATLAITLAYALGAGVPMLAIAYGSRGLVTRVKSLRPYTERVRRAFGALTVLACVALLLGFDTGLQAALPGQLTAALTGFESQAQVQKELKSLETTERKPASLPPAPEAMQPADPTATAVPAASPPAAPIVTPLPAGYPLAGAAQDAKANNWNNSMNSNSNPQLVAPPNPSIELPDLGPAQELTGLTEWINSEPLTLEALRGKVVIVDFWTFGCYNCRNTEPYVRALYDKYKDKGLVILGIHSPEFAFERVPDNVRSAVKEQGVTWPVALDPDFKTWSAYDNRYWPAFYFIDAKGRLRYTHFGEGNYDYHDKVVQQLLSEASAQ